MKSGDKENIIICFEGPSGIGKTTMSNLLSERYAAVPEVNLLFERSENEPKYWYYEKQLERYELCTSSGKSSILDGDIFQPIWYNWVCGYPSNFVGKEETHAFYAEKIKADKIKFPDLYVIFNVEEKELRARKERDKTRRRRNFEKHLKIIEPLKSYYRFLDKETPIEMRFIYFDSLENTKTEVLQVLDSAKKNEINDLKVFNQIKEWIDKNQP
ncbi:MAG: chloramphenicol acetyltransferase [Bacteroidota bacterium]